MSSYDFSTLYTTLPHNLIKDKIIDPIERTFQREGSPYLACNDRNAFFTSEKPKNIMHGHVKMYVMRLPFCWTTFLFDLASSCIDKKLGFLCTYCAPLVADLFLFCNERDSMMSLSDDEHADVIDAFKH